MVEGMDSMVELYRIHAWVALERSHAPPRQLRRHRVDKRERLLNAAASIRDRLFPFATRTAVE
jgi:hypothetical protein